MRNTSLKSLFLILVLAAGAAIPLWMVGILGQTAEAVPEKTDFNGDGYADLAIGVASEDTPTKASAGAVNVIYGSAAGLSATSVPDQFWHQDSTAIEGTDETHDLFVFALATGDFNNDGYSDL